MEPPCTGPASMMLTFGRVGQRVLKEAPISWESQPFRLLLRNGGNEECMAQQKMEKDSAR